MKLAICLLKPKPVYYAYWQMVNFIGSVGIFLSKWMYELSQQRIRI
ncbi:Uncharacterised protein [Mycobacteroides abscessus subsp. abscessus]|nr:Uncharacterised protein [Mycobacteroides abscessus subsp. abscessus]